MPYPYRIIDIGCPIQMYNSSEDSNRVYEILLLIVDHYLKPDAVSICNWSVTGKYLCKKSSPISPLPELLLLLL